MHAHTCAHTYEHIHLTHITKRKEWSASSSLSYLTFCRSGNWRVTLFSLEKSLSLWTFQPESIRTPVLFNVRRLQQEMASLSLSCKNRMPTMPMIPWAVLYDCLHKLRAKKIFAAWLYCPYPFSQFLIFGQFSLPKTILFTKSVELIFSLS